MTNHEAIETIKCAIAEVEWEYPMDYAAAFDVAIQALEEREKAAAAGSGEDSAVPLDKLCRWLADHCEPPVNMTEDWEQMEQDARAAIWRWVLEKGLEGQDAHEQQVGK